MTTEKLTSPRIHDGMNWIQMPEMFIIMLKRIMHFIFTTHWSAIEHMQQPCNEAGVLTLPGVHDGHERLVDARDGHHDAKEVYLAATHPHHEAHEPHILEDALCSSVQGRLLRF